MRSFLDRQASDAGWRRQALVALACLAMLSGCASAVSDVEQFYDSKLSPDRPVDWWHQLQGGPVAADRPPPPGADQPYPTFAAIPPRPTPIDPAARRALLARMTSQRDVAQRDAVQDPIVWPVPGAPSAPAPAKTAAATPPNGAAAPPAAAAAPADAATSTMVLDAATTPPATAPAPVSPVPVDRNPPRALNAPLKPDGAPVVSGPIPALPTAAPALPNIPGLPISTPVPTPTRTLPAARLGFAAGSAVLPGDADGALRALAARRAGAQIVVRAGGDARSADIAAQREALPLALRRTGAITAVLIAAGVPPGSIRAEATAQGREATAQLVN